MSDAGVRIDKWLWAARLFKTRSLATEAVLGGRVHVNDLRVKPSKDVHVGDVVEVTTGALRRTVHVTGVADRRGSAKVAAERRLARPLGADLGARPTKLARRRLDALRRAQRRRGAGG